MCLQSSQRSWRLYSSITAVVTFAFIMVYLAFLGQFYEGNGFSNLCLVSDAHKGPKGRGLRRGLCGCKLAGITEFMYHLLNEFGPGSHVLQVLYANVNFVIILHRTATQLATKR